MVFPKAILAIIKKAIGFEVIGELKLCNILKYL